MPFCSLLATDIQAMLGCHFDMLGTIDYNTIEDAQCLLFFYTLFTPFRAHIATRVNLCQHFDIELALTSC